MICRENLTSALHLHHGEVIILNTEQASGIAGHSRGEGPSALSRYSLLLGSYSQVCRYTVFLGHGMSKGRWNDQWNICDDIVRKTERLLVCKHW